MTNPTVYLSGPISGCTYGEATDWRGYVASKLLPGIRPISPMRDKLHLLEPYQNAAIDSYVAYAPHEKSTASAITARDRMDTQNASLVLVNLKDAPQISIGTMIELGWADSARVPVVMVADEQHDHPIVRAVCGWWCSELDDAIEIVNGILEPYSDQFNEKELVNLTVRLMPEIQDKLYPSSIPLEHGTPVSLEEYERERRTRPKFGKQEHNSVDDNSWYYADTSKVEKLTNPNQDPST